MFLPPYANRARAGLNNILNPAHPNITRVHYLLRGRIMPYTITLISPEEKEQQAERFAPRVKYEIKSEIFGCCIKLLSDDRALLETWQENFSPMSQNIRSHGRLYVFRDPSCGENTVQFDPYSKTAFLFNFSYYGWIKSIALGLCGDILEDEHGICSVHGACVDVGGKGLAMVGTSGPARPRRPTGSSATRTAGSSPTTGSLPGSSAPRSLPTARNGIFTSGRTCQPSGKSSAALWQQTSTMRTGVRSQISGGSWGKGVCCRSPP